MVPARSHVARTGKILVDPSSFGEELRALGRPIASYWPRSCSSLPPSTRTVPERNCGTLLASPPSPILEP